MNEIKNYRDELKKPFAQEDIEFRVGAISEVKGKVQALAYVTARGIMNRLDEVFGIGGWSDEYFMLETGVKCRLSVKIGEDWITKEDAAPFTNREALKGGFSDALKRAAVKLGIGRYLYNLPMYWVPVTEKRPRGDNVKYVNSGSLKGYWLEPELPSWALPTGGNGNISKLKKTLGDTLVLLYEKGILTETIANDFNSEISNSSSEDNLHTIGTRFELLRILYELSKTESIDLKTKKAIYRDILGASADKLQEVGIRLEKIKQQEAA